MFLSCYIELRVDGVIVPGSVTLESTMLRVATGSPAALGQSQMQAVRPQAS
jgi:hypothetical protein